MFGRETTVLDFLIFFLEKLDSGGPIHKQAENTSLYSEAQAQAKAQAQFTLSTGNRLPLNFFGQHRLYNSIKPPYIFTDWLQNLNRLYISNHQKNQIYRKNHIDMASKKGDYNPHSGDGASPGFVLSLSLYLFDGFIIYR